MYKESVIAQKFVDQRDIFLFYLSVDIDWLEKRTW